MIRLYRLSTGEDVIGTPIEEGDPLNEGEEVVNHINEYIKKFVLYQCRSTGTTYVIVFIRTYLQRWGHKIKHANIIWN